MEPKYKIITRDDQVFAFDETNGITLSDQDMHSSPPLQLSKNGAIQRPGSHVGKANFGDKLIPLSGRISAGSWSDLMGLIRNFQKNAIGTNLKLLEDDGVTPVVYKVSTDGSMKMDQRGAVTHSKFAVTYLASDPPYGYEADEDGNILSFNALTANGVTTDIYEAEVTYGGSADPEAQIKITITTVGDLTGLDFVDKTASRTLSIRPAATIKVGDVILIRPSVPSVTINNEQVAFTGLWPDFGPRTSSISIYAYTQSGLALDQEQKLSNTQVNLLKSTTVFAQSFTTSGTAGPLPRIQFAARKVGSPTPDITIEVRTNNSNTPGSTLHSTITLTAAQLTNAFNFINLAVPGLPSLPATTIEWMRISVAAGCDVENYYQIRAFTGTPNAYAGGSLRKSLDSGSTWEDVPNTDLLFRTYRSVEGQKNDTVQSYSLTEDFSADTRKDAGNTTALWDTASGLLTMNGTSTSYNDSTSYAGDVLVSDVSHFALRPGFNLTPPAAARLLSVTLQLKRSDNTNDLSVPIYARLIKRTSGGSYVGVATSSTSRTVNALTTSYASYAFSFSYDMEAGATYFVVPDAYCFLNSVYAKGLNTLVDGVTDYAARIVNFQTDYGGANWDAPTVTSSNNDSGHGIYHLAAGIHYATTEYAQSIELASTSADIISMSQVTETLFVGGSFAGTFQGSASADNGSNFISLPRDASPFDTETAPSTISNQLKMKWALANPTTYVKPYVNGTTVYWRKGLALDATTDRASQGFTPATSGNIARLDLYLRKDGSPGDLTLRVETDSSGSPSGTLVHANATITIPASLVPALFGWLVSNFALTFSVTLSIPYHIVASAAGVSNANRYLIMANSSGYAGGAMKRSTNSGSSYTAISSGEDMMFRMYGAAGANFAYNVSIDYNKRYLG